MLDYVLVTSKGWLSKRWFSSFKKYPTKVKFLYKLTSVISVQSLSSVWICDPLNCSKPGLPVHHQLQEFTQTHARWVSDDIQSSYLLLSLLLLPSIFPSIRVFSSESALGMRWPKYWSFSFSISPSSEHPGLISFRMDWLDLLAFQGTLNSLLQHHSSKASILQCSAIFPVQFSHPYMTNGKNIALTRGTFVGKVMSLLFNMLSRLVITFLLSFSWCDTRAKTQWNFSSCSHFHDHSFWVPVTFTVCKRDLSPIIYFVEHSH